MQPESLVQLAGSGNVTTIEQEWSRLLDMPDAAIENIARYQPVLAELSKTGRTAVAETLAWSAVDALLLRLSPAEVLPLAGSFLLAVPDGKELRTQTAELYRRVHGQATGFEAILAEAGLVSGRPVRRALRTLDLALSLQEGDYLVARDEDTCAYVESVDRHSWEFSILDNGENKTLGAVALADHFRRGLANEFRVMRCFNPQLLEEQINNDPASIIVELCRERGGKITETELAEILKPLVLSEKDWKKWWSKAKASLKKRPDLAVSGRTPVQISIVSTPASPEADLMLDIRRMQDAQQQFDRIHRYMSDCSIRGATPSADVLKQSAELFAERAGDLSAKQVATATMYWMMSLWAREKSGGAGSDPGPLEFFRALREPQNVLPALADETLLRTALTILGEARPQEYDAILKLAIPRLSLAACDIVATELISRGMSPNDFESIVQAIVSNSAAHFDALLWLWDGPSEPAIASGVTPLTLFTKIVRTLDAARREDSISKNVARHISLRARSVLAARNYERFRACTAGLEPGMLSVLRTQIVPLDNLGRTVKEDLLEQLRSLAPQREEEAVVHPWAREDIIYVTKSAMDRKREEIDHHVNVTMRDNARAIGAAAEHGDLSENSEYKFALEERDLLRARLAQMNSEMSIAHLISPGDVPSDHVGIGSRVVFYRVPDGHRYEMTFVGPWDADHAKGWFNYKAPLAQSLMGKHIGNTLRLEHSGQPGEYRIGELHNGLLDDSDDPQGLPE